MIGLWSIGTMASGAGGDRTVRLDAYTLVNHHGEVLSQVSLIHLSQWLCFPQVYRMFQNDMIFEAIMDSDVLTVSEVAAYLKIKEKIAYRLAAEGKHQVSTLVDHGAFASRILRAE